MNARHWVPLVGGLLVSGVVAGVGLAQQSGPGVAEKVGQRLDDVGRGVRREAQEVTEAVRKRFDAVRGEVGAMGVHTRVYSRVHWDNALNGSRIEVHLLRRGAVLLRGTVPDPAAKERAVALARDTVGVTEVFDELVPLASPDAAVLPSATPRAR